MRLKKAIRIAKENDIILLKDAIAYIEVLILNRDDVEEQISELIQDIEALALLYEIDFYIALEWSIEEVELYAK